MIDWLIKDARIIDGTGKPSFLGDLAVSGERIVGIGKLGSLDAKQQIKAGGRVVSPGFIDMHSHSDVLFLNGASLFHKISQGVTTELIGQDGMSAAPLTETSRGPLTEMIEPLSAHLKGEWRPWDMENFLEAMTEKESPINVASLVGHCNLRLAVMGYKMALPTPEELERMGELLAVSLKQGAMGLSLGLIYPPSSYSDTRELIALGKGVKEQDAVLVAHIRDEQDQVVQALEELIAVGRESGCRIHVSHLKCSGKRNWGRMSSVLGVLEKAFKEGIDLSFDQYPYTAGCTTLSVLLPGWAVEGGWAGLQKRLAEPEMANKIIVEMGEAIENRGGAVSITIASAHLPKNKRFVGKTLASISKEKGMPGDQAAMEMLIEEQLQTIAIFHAMAENDVEQAMAHCLQTVGSDGILGEFPHPRTYGAFPRVIHYYSGVKRLFPLEEAVRKMTSTPAKRLNLKDRGQIAPGFYADLLLFLPERFQDRATFEDPNQFATGLDWVFVNGTPVIEEGKLQERSPGHVIKKS